MWRAAAPVKKTLARNNGGRPPATVTAEAAMALAVKPGGAVDPDKRLARLREVREQERRIAAFTRASFKTAVRDREEEFARERAKASNGLTKLASASMAEALHHASVNVGAAHSAARAEREILRLEAAEGAAAWHDGVERAEKREAGALHDVHSQTAAKKASRDALVSRRERVARTEAARSAAAVEYARSLEAHQVACDRDQAAAAAARVAGPQATISRGLTPVDFASTRLHGAAEIAARTPGSVGGQVTVHRHAAVVSGKDSSKLSYAGGPSAAELARAEAERQESLLQQQLQERAEADRRSTIRGQKALARLRADEANAQMQHELHTLDKTNRAHMIAQLVPVARPPPLLWSAPPARVAAVGGSVATFASAIAREAALDHHAEQLGAEEALSSALCSRGIHATDTAQQPALPLGGACVTFPNPVPVGEGGAISLTTTRAAATAKQERVDRLNHRYDEPAGQEALGLAGPVSSLPRHQTTPLIGLPPDTEIEILASRPVGSLQTDPAETRGRGGIDVARSNLPPPQQPAVNASGLMAPVEPRGGEEFIASATAPEATYVEEAQRYGQLEQQVMAAANGLERVRLLAGHVCVGGSHALTDTARRKCAATLPPTAAGDGVALRHDRMSSELELTLADQRQEPAGRTIDGPIDRHAAFVARFEAVNGRLRTTSTVPPSPAAAAETPAETPTASSPQKMVNLLRAGCVGATQPTNVPHVWPQCGLAAAAHPEEAWADPAPDFESDAEDEPQARKPRVQGRPSRFAASVAPAPSRKPHRPPTKGMSPPPAARMSARATIPAHVPARTTKPPPPRFAAPKPEPPARRQPAQRTKPPKERSAPAARVAGEPRAKGPPPTPTRLDEPRPSRRTSSCQPDRKERLDEELRPWPAMPSELPSPMPLFDPTWPEGETPNGEPPTAGAGANAPATWHGTARKLPLTRAQMAAARAAAMPTSTPRVTICTRSALAERAASAAPAALARARAAAAPAQRRAVSATHASGDVAYESEDELQLSPAVPSADSCDCGLRSLDSRCATASSAGLFSPSDGESSSGSSSFSPLLLRVQPGEHMRQVRSQQTVRRHAYSVHATVSQPAGARAVNLDQSRSDFGAISSSSSALSLLSDPRDAIAPRAYTEDTHEPPADAPDSRSLYHRRVRLGSSSARLDLSRSAGSSSSDDDFGADAYNRSSAVSGPGASSASSSSLDLGADGSPRAACASATVSWGRDTQARALGAAGAERATMGEVAARGTGRAPVPLSAPSASSSESSRHELPQERHGHPPAGGFSSAADEHEDDDFSDELARVVAASARSARTGGVWAAGHGADGGDSDNDAELEMWEDDPMRPLSPDTAALLGLPQGCGMIEAVEWLSSAPSGSSPLPGLAAYTLPQLDPTSHLTATSGVAGIAAGGAMVGTAAGAVNGSPTRCTIREERRPAGRAFENYGVGLALAGQHIPTARAVAMLGLEIGEEARQIVDPSSGLYARSNMAGELMALPPSLEEVGIAQAQRTAGYVHLAASAAQLGSE